jgi:hypothetical protein
MSVAAGGSMLLQILLEAIVMSLVGFAVLRLLKQKKAKAESAEAAAAARLGPWPVDPSRIATRDELIRAFEYLALLRLGESARATHHRAIADRLGTTADRALAATELAELYESARYDPTVLDLPSSAWPVARRDLCLLSGKATPAHAGGAG